MTSRKPLYVCLKRKCKICVLITEHKSCFTKNALSNYSCEKIINGFKNISSLFHFINGISMENMKQSLLKCGRNSIKFNTSIKSIRNYLIIELPQSLIPWTCFELVERNFSSAMELITHINPGLVVDNKMHCNEDSLKKC